MTLVFNDKGLKDVTPPCVAQTFVPHGARLFKIYALGEKFSVAERPSLKNFRASGECRLLCSLQLKTENGNSLSSWYHNR